MWVSSLVRSVSVLAAVLAATGCGRSVVEESSAPLGSFEVSFTSFEITAGAVPIGDVPEPVAQARLELRENEGRLEASLTPPRAASAKAEVETTETAVRVRGPLTLTWVAGDYRTIDTWDEIEFARAGDALTGSFTAAGSRVVMVEDVGWRLLVTGRGVVSRDARPQ